MNFELVFTERGDHTPRSVFYTPFLINAFFVDANVRESVQKGLADYIPVFLGETSKLYRERYIIKQCRLVHQPTLTPSVLRISLL